jgi:hypothetical protein
MYLNGDKRKPLSIECTYGYPLWTMARVLRQGSQHHEPRTRIYCVGYPYQCNDRPLCEGSDLRARAKSTLRFPHDVVSLYKIPLIQEVRYTSRKLSRDAIQLCFSIFRMPVVLPLSPIQVVANYLLVCCR